MLGIKEASELGYTAYEPWFSFILQYEDKPRELLELMNRHGLEIAAVYGGALLPGSSLGNPESRAALVGFNERLAGLLAKLGAERLVIGPGFRAPGGMTDDVLAEAAETINRIAQATIKHGVLACLHPHIGTEIWYGNEVDAAIRLTDPELVGFAPDTAHLTKGGMNAADVIRRLGNRVAYVHLKDLTPAEADAEARASFQLLAANQRLPIFCEPGLGTIDFPPIMDALRDIRYCGFLTVEVDQSTSTPRNSMKLCRDYLEEQLGIPVRMRGERVDEI